MGRYYINHTLENTKCTTKTPGGKKLTGGLMKYGQKENPDGSVRNSSSGATRISGMHTHPKTKIVINVH